MRLLPSEAFSRRAWPAEELDDVERLLERPVHRTGLRLARGHGLGPMDDTQMFIQPEDVDREAAVLHPDALEAQLLEHEQHAVIFGQGWPEHQPHRTVPVVDHDLDLEHLAGRQRQGNDGGRSREGPSRSQGESEDGEDAKLQAEAHRPCRS